MDLRHGAGAALAGGTAGARPVPARSIRDVERIHCAPDVAPAAPPGVHQPEPAAPAPPPGPPVDIERLDSELWRRFEKRIRIERERRGR